MGMVGREKFKSWKKKNFKSRKNNKMTDFIACDSTYSQQQLHKYPTIGIGVELEAHAQIITPSASLCH
jgi:hypothetical protein